MRKAERRPGHQHCLPGVCGVCGNTRTASPHRSRSPALKLTEAGKRAAEGSPAKTRPHWDNSPVLEPAIKLNSAFRSPEGEKKVREAVAKAGKDPTARTLSPRPTIHTKTPASPIPAVRTESLGSPASAPAPAAAPAPVPSTPDTSAAPPPAAPAPSPPSAIPKPLPTTSPARPTISAPSVSSTGLSAHRSFDPLANPIIQSILGDMSQLTHSGSASEAVGLLQTISDKARRAALDYADQYRTAGAAASTPGSAGPAPAALAPGFSAGAPRQNTASPTRRQSSPAVAPAPRHPSPPRQPSPPRATAAPSLAINPAARSPAPAPSPSTARPSTPPQVLDFGAAIATPPLNLPPRPQEGRLLTSPGRDGIPQRDHGSYAPSAGAAPAAAASPTYPSIAHLTPPSGRRSPPQTPQRQSPPRSALSPDRLAPYPASSAYDEVTRSRALASAELRDVHAHALAVDRAAAAALSGSPASRDRFVAAEPLRDLPRERDLPLRDPREVGRDSLLLSRSAEPAVPLRDARDLPREYARELPRDLPRDLPSRDPPRGSTYDAAPRYPADRRDASPSVLDKGLRGPETYGRSPESRSLPPAPAPSTGATSALSATLPPNHPLHRYTSGSGSSEPRNA